MYSDYTGWCWNNGKNPIAQSAFSRKAGVEFPKIMKELFPQIIVDKYRDSYERGIKKNTIKYDDEVRERRRKKEEQLERK